ncbi:type IV secretion system protein [Bartonella saheliensis]|uniref:type IV secretion system protein n=1 Tax=Bartonella saheliensis TaxID=1457016 RepID=UPI0011A3CB80|nr:type IV secretion system protein [Bartonella saheliensis]
MRKVIITIAITVILGTTNSALAWIQLGAGAADLKSIVPSGWPWVQSSKPAPAPKKPVTPQHYIDIIKLLKQQLKQAKETHQSITENRELGSAQTDYTSFFLKKPELVYDENSASEIFTSVNDILQKENTSTSVQESRDAITKRIRYATIADQAVSLKTFQDAEKRFNQISELIEKINETRDLKSIAELQAYIAGMLAMIQNETAKLQMVNYSRNAEQALIKQKKYNRNMKILNSKNTKMPSIKFIR